MPKLYSAEFRREVCERMLAGEAVLDLAKEFDIGFSTLYRWKRQALVRRSARLPAPRGLRPRALAKARRRITKSSKTELTLRVKAASKLFEELKPRPKSKYQVVRGLSHLGYLRTCTGLWGHWTRSFDLPTEQISPSEQPRDPPRALRRRDS